MSAARRVYTSTSSRDMPGTLEAPFSTSGSHSPVPSNEPSAGTAPVPVISAAGEFPVNLATYRLPAERRVMLCLRSPSRYLSAETNL
ncbi:hypothetical protein D9M72_436350 [compost metagenome]